jgi:hypothetical protein
MRPYLSAYIHRTTGKPHDEELDDIIPFLVGREENDAGTFSMKQWRNAHHDFCEMPTRIQHWAHMASTGGIQEPIWMSRQPAASRPAK